jgi:hypothetical protein
MLSDTPHERRCGSCRRNLGHEDLPQLHIVLPFQQPSLIVFAYLHEACRPWPERPPWGVVWALADFIQAPGYSRDEMQALRDYVRDKWKA